jgi:predicted HTH transcriptional regulator
MALTYIQAIDNAIAFLINEDGSFKDANTVEKLEALKGQLAKRKSGKTKGQKENDVLKDEILAFMGEVGAVRAGDVATHFGISGQKASALLKQLVDERYLVKFAEKRVTFFEVADEG